MKITKSRLLQIIREEVEFHQKNLQENFFELDEETLEELSKEEGKEVIDQEIQTDREAVAAAGRIIAKKKAGTMEEADFEEDKLFDPQTKKPINKSK